MTTPPRAAILRSLYREVPLEIRIRRQTGGRGMFIQCDCTLIPDPAAEGVYLTVADVEGAGQIDLWLPRIRAGLNDGLRRLRETGGERFREVCVEISAFRTHNVDSAPLIVHRWASELLIEELRRHAALVPSLAPHRLTPDVLALAHRIQAARDFTALPLLADALEEAGCDHEPTLTHCRTATGHVTTCWAVELVLGPDAPSDNR